MSSVRVLPILAVAVFAACTSLEDVRQTTPIRSGQFDAGYKDLAACVVYETAPKYAVSNVVLDRQGKAIVSYSNDVSGPIGTVRDAIWEMTITRNDPSGGSQVDFRTAPLLDGGAKWLKAVWPVVEKCGHA